MYEFKSPSDRISVAWRPLCFLFAALVVCANGKKQPHIVVIIADDLGWNDVGFHGSVQIPTPNIDALAYAGVILNNYYVQPICTPSRSALMSGMHPIHTGLQRGVIIASQPYGLPLKFKLLPEHLSDLGYATRHVGKWHLGHFQGAYTPTSRGFQSHYGYWAGRIDYYSRTSMETPAAIWGYDFRRNMEVDREKYGEYVTDLFTEESVNIIETHNTTQPLFLYLAHLAVHSGDENDPLQAPKDIIDKFSYIKDEQRRKFAGMLWKLDESVGRVVEALEKRDMLRDSVIVFTTDNGGPAGGFNSNAASNWPFRGVKATLWEGGVRGAGCIWSPQMKDSGRVYEGLMAVEDWFPTLIAAAGGNESTFGTTDGMNMWNTLRNSKSSPRKQLLHNIDSARNSNAVRVGDWKLVIDPGFGGHHWDGWFGPSGRSKNESHSSAEILELVKTSTAGRILTRNWPDSFANIRKVRRNAEVKCDPIPKNATQSCSGRENWCLFHIPSDPCEYHNVAAENPSQVKILKDVLKKYAKTSVRPANKPSDPAAYPPLWDYTWTNWKDL